MGSHILGLTHVSADNTVLIEEGVNVAYDPKQYHVVTGKSEEEVIGLLEKKKTLSEEIIAHALFDKPKLDKTILNARRIKSGDLTPVDLYQITDKVTTEPVALPNIEEITNDNIRPIERLGS